MTEQKIQFNGRNAVDVWKFYHGDNYRVCQKRFCYGPLLQVRPIISTPFEEWEMKPGHWLFRRPDGSFHVHGDGIKSVVNAPEVQAGRMKSPNDPQAKGAVHKRVCQLVSKLLKTRVCTVGDFMLWLLITVGIVGLAVTFAATIDKYTVPHEGEVYPPINLEESSYNDVKVRRYHLVRPDLCLFPDPRESIC